MKVKYFFWIVIIAIFGLSFVFTREAQAGPCKRDQVRDPNGRCVSVPTRLERTPEPRRQPETPTRVATPPAPAPVPAVTVVEIPPAPPPTVVNVGVGISTPTLISVPGTPTLVVSACGKTTVVGGTSSFNFISQTTAVQSF